MELEVCTKCRRLFKYPGFGDKFCQSCQAYDDKTFQRVKEYIREHVTATVAEVVYEVGVREKDVYRYLREGRLEIPEDSPIFIQCDLCKTDIRSGRYCIDCARTLKNVLITYNLIGEKPKKQKNGKMRFLDQKDLPLNEKRSKGIRGTKGVKGAKGLRNAKSIISAKLISKT